MQRLVVVTDPMCSWCWGMAEDVDAARQALAGKVTFDLMLGGINTHGTQPIGDYGRRYLMKLWREVEDTTGQPFGYRLPETYIHNSARTCLAVQGVRRLSGEVPFGYLHRLQYLFFVEGEDVTQEDLLVNVATEFEVDGQALRDVMADPALTEEIRFQFEHAGSFGTEALPSLLLEQVDGSLKLFAGGYVSAEMIQTLLEESPV